MRHIGVLEAEDKLASLLDLVEQGEQVVITRHGKPIARLVPELPQVDRGASLAAAERIRQRAKIIARPFHWSEWKAFRDEGRM